MPSKKKGPAEQKSKKTIQAEKDMRISDKTFGLKNKNKSKVVQTQVKSVKDSIVGNDEAARHERNEQKKALREAREEAEREERALFSEETDVMKAKKAGSLKLSCMAGDDGDDEVRIFKSSFFEMDDEGNYKIDAEGNKIPLEKEEEEVVELTLQQKIENAYLNEDDEGLDDLDFD